MLGFTTPEPAPPGTAPPGPGTSGQTYAALDNFLQDQLTALGIPGAAVAVVRDGVQVHSAAFGRDLLSIRFMKYPALRGNADGGHAGAKSSAAPATVR